MALCESAQVAGVLKRLFVQQVAKDGLSPCRYWVVNTGNANAGTGEQGLEDAHSTRALADLADVDAEQVLPFSTGVIGETMPMSALLAALPKALEDLSEHNWPRAAAAL